ncbi:hypothetical protein B7463_g7175, partial [Scytalidium lignicola]
MQEGIQQGSADSGRRHYAVSSLASLGQLNPSLASCCCSRCKTTGSLQLTMSTKQRVRSIPADCSIAADRLRKSSSSRRKFGFYCTKPEPRQYSDQCGRGKTTKYYDTSMCSNHPAPRLAACGSTNGLLTPTLSAQKWIPRRHCTRRLDVLNRGLSGYNTDNALDIFHHILPPPSCAKVEYLLILFGANDAALPDTTGQHVPLQTYAKNIRSLLTHPSVTAHNPIILLVTPPPVDETRLEAEDLKKGHPRLTRQLKVTEKYANVIRQIAAEFPDKVFLIDLWSSLMDEASKLTLSSKEAGAGVLPEKRTNIGLESLLEDGLHLTGAGYKVFFDTVVPFIGGAWKRESQEVPSWVFPHCLTAQYTIDQTARKINSVQKQIGQRKTEEDAEDLLLQKIELQKPKAGEEDIVVVKRAALLQKARLIGNYVHDTVPVRNDEANNKVVREWTPEGFDPSQTQMLSHHRVLWKLAGYDPAGGVKLVGQHGYCLTGYATNSSPIFTQTSGYSQISLLLNTPAIVPASAKKPDPTDETPGVPFSWKHSDELIAISEEFYKSLGLPYRVVSIVSGALNNAAAKKYGLETHFPFQGEYNELVSCSNCLAC